MNTLCCEGCLPEQQDPNFVAWHPRQQKNILIRNLSATNFTTQQSFPKLTSNRNRQDKLNQRSKLKLQTNKTLLTLPETVEHNTPVNNRTVSYVPIYIHNIAQQKAKNEQIQNLKRQNSQYLSVINYQLMPLKKDYQHLKKEYEKSLQLVHYMDLKLKDLQKIYYSTSKSIFNSQLTRI